MGASQHAQALGRAPVPGAGGRAGDGQMREVRSIWRSSSTTPSPGLTLLAYSDTEAYSGL